MRPPESLASFAAPVALRSAGSKGKGLFATRSLRAGEPVLIEAPMLSMRAGDVSIASVSAAVAALPPTERSTFASLYNAHRGRVPPGQSSFGILLTNAIGIRQHPSRPQDDEIGVFALASRFNASCTPNIHHSIVDSSSSLAFRTVVNVAEGDGLTIAHAAPDFEPATIRSARRDDLEKRCRFLCVCDTCAAPDDEVAASDQRRSELGVLQRAITRNWSVGAAMGTMKMIRRAYVLCQQEQLIVQSSLLAEAAFTLCCGQLNSQRCARAWAQATAKLRATIAGPDDALAQRCIAFIAEQQVAAVSCKSLPALPSSRKGSLIRRVNGII